MQYMFQHTVNNTQLKYMFYSIVHIPYRQKYIASIPHTSFHVTCDALFMKPKFT